MSNTENLLLEVLRLQKEKQAHLQTIENTTYRTIGRKQVALTDEDRKITKNKTIAHYNQRISELYDRMDSKLENLFI